MIPVTGGDFFAVLGDGGDLTVALSVEEDNATLFSSNGEDGVLHRPGDVGGLVFVGGQIDVLELVQAHGPDRNNVGGGQNSQGVVVLVPGHVFDAGCLVRREF